MIFNLPLVVLDVENRQQPNTEGWGDNIEIGAMLLSDDGRGALFHATGETAAEEFMAWYKSVGSPPATSFNSLGDKAKLDAAGAVGVTWARDIMAVAFAQMKIAGALKRLDKGKEGRLKWPTLEEAVAFYKVKHMEAHTIEGDVDMAAEVVEAMNEMAPA